MQLSCQPKKISFDVFIPLFLVFILCPLVLFYQRYAVVILALSAIWSISYLKKILTPLDILTMLRRQITPPTSFERYINYGYFIVAFCDLFRPYSNFSIDMQIFSLLTAGFLWWHAIHYASEDLTEKLRTTLLYGIIVCIALAVIDYMCGSLIVNYALKIGKTRPLIFAKISMTLSLAIWPALYNQPLWKVCLLCIALIGLTPIFDCDTAAMCTIFGFIAYGLGSINSIVFWRFIQTSILILGLTLPFIFNKTLSDNNIYELSKIIPSYSYIHRLYIWQHVSQKIMERPFIGFGLNAGAQEEVGGKLLDKTFCWNFKNNVCVGSFPIDTKQIPQHPHNMILQWWLESGFVGIIWFSMILIFLIEKIKNLPTTSRKVTFAFFSTNIIILLVSIGVWQSWWWATWLFLLPLFTISKKRWKLIN